MTLRHHDVATSRLRTHVVEAGPTDAPTLVLVHGNVSSSRFFHPLLETLAEHLHVVAPDLRGFGTSEVAPVDAGRGVADFSDDVAALIDESDLVGVGSVHLLGWSLGGGVVLQYATDRPDRVASLVLESPMTHAASPTSRVSSCSVFSAVSLLPRTWSAGSPLPAPTSPRNVLRGLYVAPGHTFEPGEEDAYVDAMLQVALGDDNYPGDGTTSDHWPGVAPGYRGVNNDNAASPTSRVSSRDAA